MEIFLNGKPADITLDTEKTLGDIMSGLEAWISPSGNRLSGVSVDGRNVPIDILDTLFGESIDDIKKLDITVISFRELAVEAFEYLLETCECFGNAAFDDRKKVADDWEESAAARFFAAEIPEIHKFAHRAFSGDWLEAAEFTLFFEERCREIADPAREIENCEISVKNIAARMEEFPLDMQTGKDKRAAETLRTFALFGEKFFRLLPILQAEGFSFPYDTIDGVTVRNFIENFDRSLRELINAYKNQDTVQAGDIAEYELAPYILMFFDFLKSMSRCPGRESAPKL